MDKLDELPYDKRYTKGRLIPGAVWPNHVDLQLPEARNGVGLVRVPREHWLEAQLKPGFEWPKDFTAAVFLYDLSSDARAGTGRGHWFGSFRFADEAQNPWWARHPQHPVVGKQVRGRVTSLAGQRSCIVRLEAEDGRPTLLEAYLERTAVPGANIGSDLPTLLRLFPVGLQVQAEISRVQASRCALDLSVLRLIESRKQFPWRPPEGAIPHHQTDCLLLASASDMAWRGLAAHEARPDQSEATSPWAAHAVLVVDNDETFGLSLARWLRAAGAQAWFAGNEQRAEQLLQGDAKACTHLLVDYGMGHAGERSKHMLQLAKTQRDRKLAVITGAPGADTAKFVKRLSKDQGLAVPLFSKPVSFAELDGWLRGAQVPRPNGHLKPGPLWKAPEIIGDTGWEARAQAWLKACCEALSASGALWVRGLKPGFEIVAAYGLPGEDEKAAPGAQTLQSTAWQALAHRLGQTLVADVERDGFEHQRTREQAGPLTQVWPGGALCVHALALDELSAEQRSDPVEHSEFLLCFDSDSGPVGDRSFWPLLQAWWQDVRRVGQLHERMTEEAVFATQGRVHMATVHEIAALMQPLAARQRWSAEEALAWWPSGVKAMEFIKGSLYQIRRERAAYINLHDRLRTLMHDFLWQLAARREVRVIVHLPPKDLNVNLPPEVLEQPLINLVDNATKAMSNNRQWGRVEVRVELDAQDAERPLCISVSDDGHGLTPEDERRLFLPRYSHSTSPGFGMGLYVSAALVRAVGGTLRLTRNARWLGASFEIRLPLVWAGSK